MKLNCTTTNIIYKYIDEPKLKHGDIILSSALSKDTRWVQCVVSGPDSIISPGDKMMLSYRAVCYKFEYEGHELMNTSDKSTLCFKHNDEYYSTCGTILYYWLEDEEEVTESGLVLVKKNSTKELEPRWAKVFCAGPDAGVNRGDHVLLAYKTDAYKFHIDGIELHNAGSEEIICYKRGEN
jgi:hypothetical protein